MTNTTAPLNASRRYRSALSIGVAVLALAGVPAIWLHFAWSTSPASALFDRGLWTLAWPLLLAVPIAAALVRWAVSKRLSTGERWGGRLLAAAAIGVTGWFYLGTSFDGEWPSRASEWLLLEWLSFLAPLVILIGGAALTARALRTRRAPEGLDSIVMMEVAYLANAALCLLAFADQLEIGGYLVLLTSVVYGSHALAVALTSRVEASR